MMNIFAIRHKQFIHIAMINLYVYNIPRKIVMDTEGTIAIDITSKWKQLTVYLLINQLNYP